MNTAAMAPETARRPGLAVTLALIAMATVALLIVTDGNVLAALAPPLIFGLVVLVWTVPLRHSALALIFLGLATEADGDASGLWKSPLHALGVLLHDNLNQTLPIPALRFTGLDVLVAFLLLVMIVRRARGKTIDGNGFVASARPLPQWAVATVVTLLGLTAWGVVTGGDVSQIYWQTHQFALMPLLIFLFDGAFRGPRDLKALATTFLAATSVRALMGLWVALTVRLPDGRALPCVTSHSDSILFCGSVAMLFALVAERTNRRSVTLAALLVPLFFAAMIVNDRRLVWVELAGVMVTFYLVSPWTPLKRTIARGLVLSIPFLILYLVVGWQSGSRLFKPVRMVRSVVESKVDRSTEERDVENYNLLFTLRSSPVAGLGFGHGYLEAVKGDDISMFFQQYRYVPHNSLLGLWAFGGVIGFTGLWMMLAIGVFLAARAYHRATRAMERAAALSCIGAVLIYMVQCYGDMGFVSWTSTFTMPVALVVSAKLAAATGAWPTPRRRAAVDMVQRAALPAATS